MPVWRPLPRPGSAGLRGSAAANIRSPPPRDRAAPKVADCGKRRGLLAHLQEGAAVAGVAEGNKEDRSTDSYVDKIERDGLEEEIGVEGALEQNGAHALE